MYILGISGYFHDSAACILKDGEVIAAVQEERLSRKKHDASFPLLSCKEVLRLANITIDDVEHVVFYEKPYLKFDRILIRHLEQWPFAFSSFLKMTSHWFTQKLYIKSTIRKLLNFRKEISFCKHHESHAASAFYNSTFTEAVILTLDGVGEWTTGAIHSGQGSKITTHFEMQYPQSWGLFYSAFTDYLGFAINDGEYKVMGLAPYGNPIYEEQILKEMVKIDVDGSITLNPHFFTFDKSEFMLDFARSEKLLKLPRRLKDELLNQQHMDLAASVQKILEDGIVLVVKKAMSISSCKKLVMAGGVALNCRANTIVKNLPEVEDIYIFPAAGDAGGAVGAAQFFYHQILNQNRKVRNRAEVPYWGPSFTDSEIEIFLERNNYPHKKMDDTALIQETAKLLLEQKIVAWFQGRMEFGPRALGNRSILADPRRFENWSIINNKVKFREDFRPVAPAVAAEKSAKYFNFSGESPLMLFVAANLTMDLPAVTHKDGTSRIQTVNAEDNKLFHDLLTEFERYSGIPALINTSFNTAGMPIVCNIQNAFQAFAESDIDVLVLGRYMLFREDFSYLRKGENV